MLGSMYYQDACTVFKTGYDSSLEALMKSSSHLI